MVSTARRALIVVVLIAMLLGVGFAVLDYNYLGIGQVDEHGLFYISGIQDTNNNESYTIEFHGVSFTFMHYNLPVFYDENGTAHTVVDAPNTAHFMLMYPDDEVEYLNLSVGGYAPVRPVSPLRPVLGGHITPNAGVATAFTPQLHFKWVYLVAV
ncbi:MAG: hypothetical protein ACFFAD_14515 [Candidatus Hermodarchaeota archaeon]